MHIFSAFLKIFKSKHEAQSIQGTEENFFFLTVMKAASEIRYCIFEIRTGPKNGTFKEQEKTPELKNVTDASLQRLGG